MKNEQKNTSGESGCVKRRPGNAQPHCSPSVFHRDNRMYWWRSLILSFARWPNPVRKKIRMVKWQRQAQTNRHGWGAAVDVHHSVIVSQESRMGERKRGGGGSGREKPRESAQLKLQPCHSKSAAMTCVCVCVNASVCVRSCPQVKVEVLHSASPKDIRGKQTKQTCMM